MLEHIMAGLQGSGMAPGATAQTPGAVLGQPPGLSDMLGGIDLRVLQGLLGNQTGQGRPTGPAAFGVTPRNINPLVMPESNPASIRRRQT